jgi:hypothetical protein
MNYEFNKEVEKTLTEAPRVNETHFSPDAETQNDELLPMVCAYLSKMDKPQSQCYNADLE